jgi:DNA-directed RNA polymerase sigma subunit (sigma70/sigma32)
MTVALNGINEKKIQKSFNDFLDSLSEKEKSVIKKRV